MVSGSLLKVAATTTLLMSLLFTAAPPAAAAVYKVGDKVGWTILGSPNYTAWAASKSFHVGDTLVFEYNKQFHNVLQVTKSGYDSCSSTSPAATFATGNDSVTIKSAGHLYFLCGIPGHCQSGQKVDILASKGGSTSSAPSPSALPPSASAGSPATGDVAGSGLSSGPAASPKASGVAGGGCKGVGVVVVAGVYGFVMGLLM